MIRTEAKFGRVSDVSYEEYVARKKWAGRLKHIFRSEVIDNNNSLELAEKVSRRNEGLVVVSTHFSKTDPVHAMLAIVERTEIAKKKIIVPIAVHQDKSYYHRIGEATAIKVMPIVTENTLKRKKYKNRKLNEGGKEYLNEAVDSIGKGETVFVSAQGERAPHLGQPEKPTIGLLMFAAEQKGIKNYSILFVGFEIKGTKDYSKKRGFNFLNKYTTNIGACLSNNEILERATEMAKQAKAVSGKRENPFKYVEQVVFEELRKVVPPSYR
jgi:hypothetical protein